MPTHEIPNILFGVQNRVSYKSRQVKNSTINTYYGAGSRSIFKATLHEDLYYPDWLITSDLEAWSRTYLDGYYVELIGGKNPLLGGDTVRMKETSVVKLKTIEAYNCLN